MYTFGFNFKHWNDDSAIAGKDKILSYLKATVREFGIDRNIIYEQHIVKADWDSATSRWTISNAQGESFTCNFLFMCSGYYDYDEAHAPTFKGVENFTGELVHPQFWPENLDYADKKIIVIGSGATAVTLLPSMAKSAEHVTMLQRSPTYMGAKPAVDPVANKLGAIFGRWAARWWFIFHGMFIYWMCKTFPNAIKKRMIADIEQELGDKFDPKHFTPSYMPWDQRVCLCPDSDFFTAIKSGKASVETDQIDRFTDTGIALQSGKQLDADIVVTATGLKISLMGGMSISVDGTEIKTQDSYVYKGMMLSGVPNTFIAVGYTNASWTLKVDLAHRYALRMINKMQDNGFTKAVPKPNKTLEDRPFLDLTSSYIHRAESILPKQAAAKPWKLNQNFILDNVMLRFTSIDDEEMKFS